MKEYALASAAIGGVFIVIATVTAPLLGQIVDFINTNLASVIALY